MRTKIYHASFVFLALVLGGCASNTFNPELAVEKRELSEVYEDYLSYRKEHGKAPTELAHMEERDALYAIAVRVLREGKYKVVWGVEDENPRTLLAYHKDVPEQGGVVLMADGTIKTMTVAQYNAASPR